MTPFGQACKKLRLKRNMSLNTYANILGFTSSYVANKESGRDKVSESYLNQIIKSIVPSEEEKELLKIVWLESRNEITVDISSFSIEKRKSLLGLLGLDR